MSISNKKVVVILFALTFSSKIVSFLREVVIANLYGATNISDVYIVSLSIPMILFSGISTAILTAYIPINNEIILRKGKNSSIFFTVNLIKIATITMILFTILGCLFANQIVSIFFRNYSDKILNLATLITRINFPIIIFIVISNILIGYLQCNNGLIEPNISLFLYNILFLSGVIGSSFWGIEGVAYVNVASVCIQVMYLYWICKKVGLKMNFTIPKIDDDIKNIIFTSIPIFIGVFSQQVNSLIDKFLGTNLGTGIVSAFSYSDKLTLLIYGFILVSISNFIYPKLAQLSETDQWNRESIKYLNVILSILAPIIIIFTLFAENIVEIVFMRGAFNYEAVKTTSNILKWYSVCIMFWTVRDLLSKILFLHKNSKAVMINTIIGTILNIILSILLSVKYGYIGIAIGTTISSAIISILIIRSLIKKYNFKLIKSDKYKILTIFISSCVSVIILRLINIFKGNLNFVNNQLLNLIIISIIVFSIYMILLLLMNIKQINKRKESYNAECI